METRAHHVLIGAFTLVVVALVVLFALWLGKTSLNRQFHYYDIVFTEAVTGLSKGSAVQYNG
ncbi:MAG: MlaD family protein, partial [Rhodanobacteraceae bacterium]